MAATLNDRERDVGSPLSDIGPRRRRVEILDADGRLLARWEGWSLTHWGAVANADRLRSDRQPRTGRSAR